MIRTAIMIIRIKTAKHALSGIRLVIIALGMLAITPLAQAKIVSNKTFGSWSVTCGQQNCAMTQLVTADEAAKQVMLGVSVNFAFKSKLGSMMVRLPANINMKGGLGIKVDDNSPIQLPISQCNAKACQSVVAIDQTLLDEFSEGTVAKFAYARQNQHQLILPISLTSFRQAYDYLVLQQAARQPKNSRK
jgi:invasion protein IalB